MARFHWFDVQKAFQFKCVDTNVSDNVMQTGEPESDTEKLDIILNSSGRSGRAPFSLIADWLVKQTNKQANRKTIENVCAVCAALAKRISGLWDEIRLATFA